MSPEAADTGDAAWEVEVKRALGALPEVSPPPGYFERMIRHQRPRYSRRLVACGVMAAALTALGVSVDTNPTSELAGLLDIPLDGSDSSGERLLVVLGAEPDGSIVDGPGTDLADLLPARIDGAARHDFGVEHGAIVAWYGAVRVAIADRTTHAHSEFGRDVRVDPANEGTPEAWIFDRGANRFTLAGPAPEVGKVAAGLSEYLDGSETVGVRVEAIVRESLGMMGFPT